MLEQEESAQNGSNLQTLGSLSERRRSDRLGFDSEIFLAVYRGHEFECCGTANVSEKVCFYHMSGFRGKYCETNFLYFLNVYKISVFAKLYNTNCVHLQHFRIAAF